MKKVLLSLSAVALLAFTSCEKKEATAISESETIATASDADATYAVDSEDSKVYWRGYKIYEGETEEQGHHGTINVSEGSIHLEDNKIVAGDFTIDVNTLDAEDLKDSPEDKGKLEGHLKSGDFLNIEQYPNATFHITGVNSIEGEYNTEISGNLKIMDAEKNITVKANVAQDGDDLTIASEEFTIDRKEFGINFDMTSGDVVIKDNVTLSFKVKADKTDEVVTDTVVTEEVIVEEPVTEDAAH